MEARIAWLGHATVLMELDGVRLLTDPVLHRRVGPLVRIAAGVPSHQHERIDAVLLSHLHGDHVDLPSLRRLGRDVRVVAPAGAGAWLRARGMRCVEELAVSESTAVGPLQVVAVPAQHDGQRLPHGPSAAAIGFVVRGTHSVYFAGDTDLLDDMERFAGGVDVALLPVAGWGPTLGPGHLDPARAAQAAARIHPRVAIPIHWGTLAVPLPPLINRARSDEPAQRFAALVADAAPQVEVRVLAPGEAIDIARPAPALRSPASERPARSPGPSSAS